MISKPIDAQSEEVETEAVATARRGEMSEKRLSFVVRENLTGIADRRANANPTEYQEPSATALRDWISIEGHTL